MICEVSKSGIKQADKSNIVKFFNSKSEAFFKDSHFGQSNFKWGTNISNDDWLDNDGDNEDNPGLINWCNQQNKEEIRSDCDSELNKTKHITIFRLQVLPVQLLVTKERKQVSLEAMDEEENVKKDTIGPSRLSSLVLRTPLR